MSQLLKDINVVKYNTFNIEAKAKALFKFTTTGELIDFLINNLESYKNILPIGSGSNLLFTEDFDGCLIKAENTEINIIENTNTYVKVNVGAGLNWDTFVEWAVNNKFYGIENLSYIPGKVGSTPVQNIGAYGVEVKDYIEKAYAINIKTQQIKTFSNKECKFGYRDSIFKNELKNQYVITNVEFKLLKNASLNTEYGVLESEIDKIGDLNLKNLRTAIINIRKQKLPNYKTIGNAGSFFKNPIIDIIKFNNLKRNYPNIPNYKAKHDKVKIAAGWLIEQCGLKGYVDKSGAGVHDNQALILVNKGVENGMQILNLSKHIQEKVKDKFNISIEPEVTII